MMSEELVLLLISALHCKVYSLGKNCKFSFGWTISITPR